MVHYQRKFWLLAISLSALAGFVDAIGFIKLGGLFVSFMTGNSTRMAVEWATAPAVALSALKLITSFVLGVMIGTLIRSAAGRHPKPAVLAFVALSLGLAAGVDAIMATDAPNGWTVALLALAMGGANAVFQRNGEVSIGVTYMTGTLVKLGQRLVSALQGGDRWQWLPYLLLWAGFIAGAATGALAHAAMGSISLLPAAGFAALLALLAIFAPENTALR